MGIFTFTFCSSIVIDVVHLLSRIYDETSRIYDETRESENKKKFF